MTTFLIFNKIFSKIDLLVYALRAHINQTLFSDPYLIVYLCFNNPIFSDKYPIFSYTFSAFHFFFHLNILFAIFQVFQYFVIFYLKNNILQICFLTLKSELYFEILYLFLSNNNKIDILIAVCFDNFCVINLIITTYNL